MLSIQTTLVLALTIVSLADASAIKGHPRPAEEARSIKLAPQSNNIDKSVKQQPQQAPAAILESTKKIYNDESIRRLAAQQQLIVDQAPVAPLVVAPAAIKQSEPVVVAQKEAEIVPKDSNIPVAAPVVPVAPVSVPAAQPVAPVVVQPAPVVPVAQPAQPIVLEQPVVVAAAPVKPVVDDLPAQSERSAPIVPPVAPVAPVVVEQPAVVKIVEQPAYVPLAPVQPEPVVVLAVVPPVVASSPVVEPVKESVLEAKKESDVQPAPVVPVSEPMHIEVPAPDPGLVLSEPIDSTTKLLIDLDEHVQKFLPAEDKQEPSVHKDHSLVAGVDYSPSASSDPTGKSAPIVPYSAVGSEDSIVPPLPSLDGVEKASAASGSQASAPGMPSSGSQSASGQQASRQGGQNHHNQQQVISQLLTQLDNLQNRIQDTINQLVARRRYVMSALLRPMGTYVRRVRSNLERLQNRVNQLQSAAVSGPAGGNRPGFVDAAAIETIRRRIDDISKRISDIVNRIRFSLTPTSAPLNNGRK